MDHCFLDHCLLIIFASPALEESMVDWLLENDSISGFSTMHGYGHGTRPSAMSLLEQVAGRQRRVEFMIETTREITNFLIADLQKDFSGAGLHYMVMPLIESGRI
jgi:hypothetical protein